jgi:hypothetical protein
VRVTIITKTGDEIAIGASVNLDGPVRMTVKPHGAPGEVASADLDEGSNDVLRSALLALWSETS